MADYFVHEKAIVETNHIGKGSHIWAFVHILPGAKIGENANICDHCFVENQVVIGNNVTIKSGVYIWDGVTIEDDVMVGPAAVFSNDKLPRSKNPDWKQEPVTLKKGCSIGANSTLLPGIVVGSYALVGAGSVVSKDVPDFALVYGNPARTHGYICVCTKKLNFVNDTYSCSCGRSYKKNGDMVTLLT